jgi:hypothetical protein
VVAYNFQEQFVERITKLDKRQTIRPIGKRKHARPGDALQLYTGMRTAKCRKLLDAVCTASAVVNLDAGISIAGRNLDPLEADAFAVADGFGSTAEMLAWFESRYGLPFEGVCIQW